VCLKSVAVKLPKPWGGLGPQGAVEPLEGGGGNRPVTGHQKYTEQKQPAFHITFEAWKVCLKHRLVKLARALWKSSYRRGEKTGSFWHYDGPKDSLIYFFSLISASHDQSFIPQGEILYKHFTSKFSVDSVSISPLRSILRFTNNVLAAAKTSPQQLTYRKFISKFQSSFTITLEVARNIADCN
jgi:hypothetical protein